MNISPLLIVSGLMGCGGQVSSEREARAATLGLEGALAQAIDLGLDGFTAASSANIPEQAGVGAESGTTTINGQVDQGNSDNKGLRLDMALVGYSDGPVSDADGEDGDADLEWLMAYDTLTDPVQVDLQLRDMPEGTMSGTLSGTVTMTGDLAGDVTLTLSMVGETDSPDGTAVVPATGTLHITGSAATPYGAWDVDLTR